MCAWVPVALAVDEKKEAFAKEHLVSREDISVTFLEVHRLDFIPYYLISSNNQTYRRSSEVTCMRLS